MKLSIAIICSNDHLLKKCIESIPKTVPVIIIFNYPDKYVLNLVKNYKNVTIYRCDERNLGKLRQLAVTKCNTPAICYVDSDCVISQNLIKTVENELDIASAVNIPLDFDYNNLSTKIVSICRKYTTPDAMLYMPFAFRLKLQKEIGNLFNEKLYWGEDSDQRKRMKEKGIEYIVSKSRIKHKTLTMKEDVRSAIRLGLGTYVQEQNGINSSRSLLKDLSIISEIKGAYFCSKFTKSFLAGLYHFFVWRPAYKLGYWKVKIKNEHKNKKNN